MEEIRIIDSEYKVIPNIQLGTFNCTLTLKLSDGRELTKTDVASPTPSRFDEFFEALKPYLNPEPANAPQDPEERVMKKIEELSQQIATLSLRLSILESSQRPDTTSPYPPTNVPGVTPWTPWNPLCPWYMTCSK